MIKKYLLALASFIVVVAVLGAVKAAQINEVSSVVRTVPPIAVTSAVAQSVVWKPLQKSIGTLAPIEGVTIAPDADGTVTKIYAESGAAVKEGDLLLELDATVELAQLVAAQAQEKLAELDFKRTTDLVARLGGDEFLVVLNEIHSLEEAVAVAHKLQASANQPVVVRGRSLHPTLSIGLSLQAPGESIDSVNERADRALYEAKNAGGNRVVEVGLP